MFKMFLLFALWLALNERLIDYAALAKMSGDQKEGQ